ncbi:MAG: RecQ family ATP-dependent DNA helicase, partial [Bacteroidota bacterium]
MSAIHNILKQYWGYDSFRPLQEEIIQTALSGNDCLALLPTGGGKSLCFQVPALTQEGVCLVVSPLIALMKDQVQQLQARGIRAAAVYAGMNKKDIDRIVDNAVYGHLKFLYVSPERLKTDILQARLPKMPVNLLAIDEAHCISQWGYDFRPAYLEIAQIRELLPKVPLMALTATATPDVVQDIQDKLLFKKDSKVWQKSFVRENLAYVVRAAEGKMAQLVKILNKVPGSAVIYVRSRRRCKEIAIELNRRKIPASFYHAGVDMDTRSVRQEAWIAGKARVMVATNAFGMG